MGQDATTSRGSASNAARGRDDLEQPRDASERGVIAALGGGRRGPHSGRSVAGGRTGRCRPARRGTPRWRRAHRRHEPLDRGAAGGAQPQQAGLLQQLPQDRPQRPMAAATPCPGSRSGPRRRGRTARRWPRRTGPWMSPGPPRPAGTPAARGPRATRASRLPAAVRHGTPCMSRLRRTGAASAFVRTSTAKSEARSPAAMRAAISAATASASSATVRNASSRTGAGWRGRAPRAQLLVQAVPGLQPVGVVVPDEPLGGGQDGRMRPVAGRAARPGACPARRSVPAGGRPRRPGRCRWPGRRHPTRVSSRCGVSSAEQLQLYRVDVLGLIHQHVPEAVRERRPRRPAVRAAGAWRARPGRRSPAGPRSSSSSW